MISKQFDHTMKPFYCSNLCFFGETYNISLSPFARYFINDFYNSFLNNLLNIVNICKVNEEYEKSIAILDWYSLSVDELLWLFTLSLFWVLNIKTNGKYLEWMILITRECPFYFSKWICRTYKYGIYSYIIPETH